MCEARNAGGTLLNQYFLYGETISGSNYFYTKDRLASVRELTDSSGNLQAEYSYEPYGRVTQLQGSLASDFQYAGYYLHASSGLNLAVYRVYNASLGRWIERDPINEGGGVNLYAYVLNSPITNRDPLGLVCPLHKQTRQKCLDCCARRAEKAKDKCRKDFEKDGDLKKYLQCIKDAIEDKKRCNLECLINPDSCAD